ncbi:staygreen family protein [Alicyclobacillus ferrooxydans]|uniref:Staygreen protein domain-containing protein n=1 Tax=Alicyclobacillus ferrooxydans TaxID=471514 RepID=A0A0P9EPV5_9BACL|nr:staygreen family protein [Alicyclobacillus ferrooxydans]KPV40529.1 hypothetical protein AN477_21820 [Alicyclobacillus ferrooxydans]
MPRLKPEKLHVRFMTGSTPEGPIVPRRYTLTHSDRTGDLYLTIGPDYNHDQLKGIYARLMRDEVLGEWKEVGDSYLLEIYVHVSGGRVIGSAKWRNKILHREMPLVLEGITYAEEYLLRKHPVLEDADIRVHFQSHQEKYNTTEDFGTVKDYRHFAR